MTCIAGLVKKNIIYIGADSQTSKGSLCLHTADHKVFRKGEFLIGVSGSTRVSHVIKNKFELPEHASKVSITKYMSVCFADSLRECFNASGVLLRKENRESASLDMLIGYRGKLFNVCSDFTALEVNKKFDYYAVGSGDQLALGSLYTTNKLNLDPKERIKLALLAAAEFDAWVREPFVIKTLEA